MAVANEQEGDNVDNAVRSASVKLQDSVENPIQSVSEQWEEIEMEDNPES